MAAPKKQIPGICIICGCEKTGAPAIPDIPVSAARKARSILRLAPSRTIVCRQHANEAAERRSSFEKKLQGYRIYAAIAFFAIIAGSFILGKISLQVIAAAIAGAAFLFIMPYFHYFPDFRLAGRKA